MTRRRAPDNASATASRPLFPVFASSRLRVAAIACALASCGGDGPSEPREVASQIELLGPASRTGEVGTEIDGPRVRVRGTLGTAMPDIGITCYIAAGVGTLSTSSVTTDAEGTATCGRWTLAQQPEVAIARATAPGLDTVQLAVNVRPGPAVKLGLVRGISGDVFSDLLADPQPIVATTDRFGNPVPRDALTVTARTNVAAIVVYGATARTTSNGRAEFTRLGFSGPTGPFVVTFEAPGMESVSSVAAALQPAPPGAAIPARVAFRVAGPRIVVLNPTEQFTVPPVDAFNVAEIPIPLAITRVAALSPSLVGVDGDTILTAIDPGRSFIIARSVTDTTVRDSMLVYVTRNATGPLLHTDLPAFALTIGTDVVVRVLIDMRSAGALAGATVDVAYPESSPSLLGLLAITPASGTVATLSPTAGLIRFAYVNATGASGIVELARLQFRVLNGTPNVNQLVLTPVDIVSATLQDLTPMTTAMNPPFAVRQ